jgi:RraA family protein
MSAQPQSRDAMSNSEIIEAFRAIPTSLISDCLDRLPGSIGLQRFYDGPRMVGTALTVRTRVGDNLALHQALEIARPGEILVVDGGGDTSRALVGEIMKEIAEMRGMAGFVIDGAIRDLDAFIASPFGCFAKASIHRGPYKNGPGKINVSASIGGCVINPGDIIVGDHDGIVSFSQEEASMLLAAARAQGDKEDAIIASIRAGTYSGSYAKGA